MKKLIFINFLKDVTKTFIIIGFSISLIVWVIQAVKFLDLVTGDGHSFNVYFLYTLLNLPKIIHRILPFIFFISLFYQISQYELKNELLVFWTNGVNKIKFINVIFFYSLIITLIQIILGGYISPLSQDQARNFIRNSNVDFFPSLIREGKFIDTVSNLTIFIESQDEFGNFKNIFLKDYIEMAGYKKNENYQLIYAKSGQLSKESGKRYFELFDGRVVNNKEGEITNFKFERIDFNLENYVSKTTQFPKIQEVKSSIIFDCLYYSQKDQQEKFKYKTMHCTDRILKDITQEFLKRFYKPFYLPVLALITSLLILHSKENTNYNKFKLYIFFISFFVIIISEFSLRYSASHIKGFLFFILFPVLSYLITYIFLLIRYKNKI
ncbi:LptF/LptG family permease [Candidatus Pelagibacter sp.]|nr:LptF/LptG family permease [Candidatus Pelagibacter sp.]